MIEIEIDVSQVLQLAKKYDLAKGIVTKETLRTMHKAIAVIKPNVKRYTPVGATGELHQGVEGIITTARDIVEGRVTVVGTAAGYVEPVEFGSVPHWPPVEPIRLWVRRVKGTPPEEVPRVAFLVSRKISRIGTPAFKMFQQGWAESEPKVMSMFNVLTYKIVEGIER